MRISSLIVAIALINTATIMVLVSFLYFRPPVKPAEVAQNTTIPIVIISPMINQVVSNRNSAFNTIKPDPSAFIQKTNSTVALMKKVASTFDSRCLLQIKGNTYDVTQFRNIHMGGNIFQCNSDMTSVFSGQHPDSYLGRMEKYKI